MMKNANRFPIRTERKDRTALPGCILSRVQTNLSFDAAERNLGEWIIE